MFPIQEQLFVVPKLLLNRNHSVYKTQQRGKSRIENFFFSFSFLVSRLILESSGNGFEFVLLCL